MEEFEYQADVAWDSDTEQSKHNVELKLDLETFNQVGKDFAVELTQKEGRQALKERLFDTVSTKVIPKIINDCIDFQGVDNLKTQAETKWSTDTTAEIANQVLNTRNSIKIGVDLTSDKPVHALEALYNERGGVADTITHGIMNNLDNIYVGQPVEQAFNSEFNLGGDEVIGYQEAA